MTYREAPRSEAPTSFEVVADARRLFPRPHPHATTVLVLGALSLFPLGPVAGVPAIVLGSVARREVAAASQLFTEGKARIGIVAAWIGSLGYCGLGVLILAKRSTMFGLCAAALGLLLGVIVVLLRTRLQTTRIARAAQRAWPPLLLGAAMLPVAGFGGVLWHRQEALAAAARCQNLGKRGEAELEAARFDDAKRTFREAEQICRGSARTTARERLTATYAKEDEHKRQALLEQFTREQANALKGIAESRSLAHQEKWEEADAKLESVESALAPFGEHDHIATSQSFKTITSEIVAERQHIAPYVDASRQQRVRNVLLETRAFSARSQWEQASTKLAEATELWRKLSADAQARFAPAWKKLEGEIDKERARIEPSLAALRQRQQAAAEAARKREELRQRQAQAAAEAREASRRLRCCDGTLSPSCLCSRASRRGCCSHHGGVCGCE